MHHTLSAFDLDHTLFKVNTSYRFGVYLYQQKVLSRAKMLYLVGCYAIHKMGFVSISQLHDLNFRILFQGKSLRDFQRHAIAFLNIHWDELVYAPAIAKLREAQKKGRHTVILSASPDFLVAPIAQRLGVTDWRATQYAVDDSWTFSGVSSVMEGEHKASCLMALAEQLAIPRDAIIAYSDSILDTPLLMAAGTAVGVNPDRQLRALCKRSSWEVI